MMDINNARIALGKAHRRIDMLFNSWLYFQEGFVKSVNKDEVTNAVLQNRKFEKCHKGKKCYILGNAPSLNKIDFEKLENEFVFTVNELFRSENFKKLKSNYHIIVDPFYFERGTLDAEFLALLNNAFDKTTTLFVPILGYDLLSKRRTRFNVQYFKHGLILHEKFSGPMDFSRIIPATNCVVHYAIMLAIYMGFREIVLLGCEGTDAARVIYSIYTNEHENVHAYQEDERFQAKFQQYCTKRKQSTTFFLNGYSNIFNQYRWIYEYSKKKRIDLYNGSEISLIDSIPIRAINL